MSSTADPQIHRSGNTGPTPSVVAGYAASAALTTTGGSTAASSSAPGTLDPPGKVRFLMELSIRFEREGNVSESVKSAETALLLRRSLPPESQALFSTTLAQQAADLVAKCNALGVQQFQQDQYPLAEFLLSKALFLSEDAKTTNCFGPMEHERLRLRAATFNNLGCLEKRRGQLEAALAHLHKAAEIEGLVDPDVGASPSTQLNLCTLLNKMGRHTQAAAAAERAVRHIEFQAQQGVAPNAAMILMAHYNHGVSLEFMGRPTDLQKARDSYVAVMNVGSKLGVAPETNAAMQQAQRALERLEASMPQTARTGLAGSGLQVAREGAGSRATSAASSDYHTPRAPGAGALRQPPPQSRGIMTAPAGGKRGNDAMSRHRDRIQLRQKRREMADQRSRDALRRAQLAHDREKSEKLRIEQEAAARQRDEMARALYEQMESGIRADRIRTLFEAARAVQRVWRGFLVRAHLRDMAVAVVKIQAVVRSHLCRLFLKRAETQARMDEEQRRALLARHEAAIKIQRRCRIFLRRCTIVRQFRARQLRRRHCAMRIVFFYQAYRRRVADRILDKLEQERMAIQARNDMLNEAARKIQTLYRSYKSRRFMRVVRQEQLRRNAAATKIQAAMRGSLTRAWFKHYRLYRRQQELSTAANLKSIVKIQCAWRMALAKMARRQLSLEKHRRERLRKLFVSARRIQCGWRSYVARGVAFDKRVVLRRRNAAAEVIQRRWLAFVCRREYLWKRDEARKMRALLRLQQWWREMLLRNRHIETAKYHVAMLRRERELAAKTYLALTATTIMRYLVSSRLMQEKRVRYVERSAAAATIQRIGRGEKERADMSVMKRVALLVAKNEETKRIANGAACVIQRAVRVFQAKEKVNLTRRQRWAAIRIQCIWRMAKARMLLSALRIGHENKVRDAAARRIQKSIRLFFQRQELKRLDVYYTARRRHKLHEQRRVEASTTIQAHWRGYATRAATANARAELLAQTVQVIRIQRAWRTHLYRRSINEEIARRQRQRLRRVDAANKMQSFWRRVLAAEYVALVRERKFNHTVAVICIQCAFRRMAARAELRRRRDIRQMQQRLSAQRHDAWTLACVLVQTVLRHRRDALNSLVMHESQLTEALETKLRLAHIRRCNAATKIQASYRGHYERVYARGVRAEAHAKEMERRALEAKRSRAALKIQCAWRCAMARHRAAELRTTKRLQQLEEDAVEEERTEPSNVVKSMFWAHEAHIKRDLTRERQERHEVRTKAAIAVQRIVRGFVYRRRFIRRTREAVEKRAAGAIQSEWRKHAAAQEAKVARRREVAATKIQSIARMFFVIKSWPQRQRELDRRRTSTVRTEEMHDGAATKVQSVWRGHKARVEALDLHDKRTQQTARRVQFEAARMIQKHVRRLLAINRVTKIRFDRMHGSQEAKSGAQPQRVSSRQQQPLPAPTPPGVIAQQTAASAVTDALRTTTTDTDPADSQGVGASPAAIPETADGGDGVEHDPPVPPPRRNAPPEPEQRQPRPPVVPRPPSGGPSGARRRSQPSAT